jgi:hypothetical protein
MATSARTKSKTITGAQIGQITDRLVTGLRESGLPIDGVQLVLAAPGGAFIDEMIAVLRKRVEANSNLIVRDVSVRPNQEGRQALEATGRRLYVDDDVVKTMPHGTSSTVKVTFFKLDLSGGYISDDNLEGEFNRRGLKPADPFSLAAVNEADPAFADEHPNCTHWKDKNGKWCFGAFRRWGDGRRVDVRRDGGGRDGLWFAGVSE